MSKAAKIVTIFCPYPLGTAPSQRFRFEQYIEELSLDGININVLSFLDNEGWNILYKSGNVAAKIGVMLRSFLRRWKTVYACRKADFIFVHREMCQVGPPIFEFFVAKILRKKIIFDFDDAIWLPNYSEVNARFHWVKCYWKIPFIIRWSYKIVAGNDYLANYAQKYNPEVIVIPTTIDMVNYHNGQCAYDESEVVIGWTGSHTTMQYLPKIVDVVKRLSKKYPIRLRVISNENPQLDLDNFEFVKWNKSNEIDDLKQFHIGVMPLDDDQWAKGKCGFKALQYMSLGIPSVISPVGVNTQIVEDGVNGFLFKDEIELYDRLEQLIISPDLRERIGLAGKKTVADFYSTTANFKKYVSLFE